MIISAMIQVESPEEYEALRKKIAREEPFEYEQLWWKARSIRTGKKGILLDVVREEAPVGARRG